MKILYIDVDSLRPDHLGCYGYPLATSPHIDSLADEGAVFLACHSSDAPCGPSRSATFSGRFGVHNGIVTHGPRGQHLATPGASLQQWLSTHGTPAAAVSTYGDQVAWFFQGWQTYIRPCPGRHLQRVLADEVTTLAAPWLEAHAQDDFFLFVHYWDPHTPYNAPRPYLEHFPEGSVRAYPEFDRDTWSSAAARHITSHADAARWVGMYDGEIAYADHHVGVLLDVLRRRGVLDETLIIVTSDHGEHQGEQGVFGDHPMVYEATTHVPLVLRWPGHVPAGVRSSALVYLLDIAPTLAEAVGEAPAPDWDGKSLWPLLRGEAEAAHPFLVCGQGLWTAQRALLTPEWKLVRTYHPGFWKMADWGLFDRAKDPWDATDVAAEHPEVVAVLRSKMLKWVDAELGARVDPLRQVAQEGPDAYTRRRRLMDTGRVPAPGPGMTLG